MIRHGAPGKRPHAGERCQQFALPVARDARNADDLARAHGEARVVNAHDAGRIDDGQVLNVEHGPIRRGLGLGDPQQHAPPDHEFGEFFRRRIGGRQGADHFAAPHDRDTVRHGQDLAQLVGDQDDGLTLVLELTQDAEQVIRLGRGQDTGRFVENENVGAAEQGFQDLDPLLLADGQGLDRSIERNLQTVVPFKGGEGGSCLLQTGRQRQPAFGAEHHVFEHGERVDQHEVLMHHADAAGDRVVGTGDLDRLAIDPDLAAVGPVEAVEDRHEGRLAGAVLTDNAVDRATCNAQGDVAVGANRAKPLVDALKLDCRRAGLLLHSPPPPGSSAVQLCALNRGIWSRTYSRAP